ncbi:conserved hypothetical protein [Methanohalobium evestigatum Z-7303]|uniref:Uncharacterized protein n=1 Tax=Methanohalobium evestigatum (strain ATCC BAA-1072 / DSM 3721 / NBRC 107634 / OCM 161 / Z-7303) TaxID=644295 RepID=D7E7Y2_METEZ|nr:hypothetical protein [Methanohalobium evestigatum]ADI73324.1 conserved hypothetical protein [Methanohalobium evestigatum Z-7303]
MKIRLEIIDDDGNEKVNVEFAGENWREYLTKFIYTIDVHSSSTESSSSQMPNQNQPISQQYQYYPTNQQPSQTQYQQPVNQPLFTQQPVQQQPANTQFNQPPQYQAPINQQPPQNFAPVNNQQIVNREPKTPSLREKLNDATLTINERLELFLKYEYPRVWFSSQDIQEQYEKIYGKIKLSTVSTYLSRMYRKNLLERRGNRTQREYRYIGDMGTEDEYVNENVNDNMGYVPHNQSNTFQTYR